MKTPEQMRDQLVAELSAGKAIPFAYDDGGRGEHFKGRRAGDCVTRAITIASGRPYLEVYATLNLLAKRHERPRAGSKRSTARDGVHRRTAARYLESIGAEWIPTMAIGSGCRVHVRAGELPPGRLVLSLSRHMAAVVDGVLRDTYDCSRDGTRCVYGYWIVPAPEMQPG